MQRIKNLQCRFKSIEISFSLSETQNLIIFRDVLWKGSTDRSCSNQFFPILDPLTRSTQGENDEIDSVLKDVSQIHSRKRS